MQVIKNIFSNFKRYSFLMKQLVIRDFKVKYKRSVLGVIWSLLYPLLMMAVMAVVFSQMFKVRVEGVNYLVYLLSGLVFFNYFNEASSTAMTSIISNFSLMTKVYIPKYIFPLSKCLFVGINFLLTLIPLLFIILFTGSGETKCFINIYYLILPYIFLCLFMFTLGVGFILSTLSVFLRDVIYIYGIVLLVWQYLTPIFYDISMLPETLKNLMMFNPMYVFINSARDIFIFSQAPSTMSLILCIVYGLGALLIGGLIFKKNQDKFIYYA